MGDRDEAERGKRMRQVRDTRGETQADFATRLNEKARLRHWPADYTFGDVSQFETNRKYLTFEVAQLIADLDPERRGFEWVVFGVVPGVDEDASRSTLRKPTKRRAV
jgi:transcriptional regulator with XRE-family HTH domain